MLRTPKVALLVAVVGSVSAVMATVGAAAQTPPDARTIIERSVAANQRDWAAAPDYEYMETDRDKDATRSYRVTMILGTPYKRLIAINGKRLPKSSADSEQKKFEHELARRRSESPDEHAKRLKSYNDERERDRVMMSQISTAFDFKLVGHDTVAGRDTYVLQATPRAGYKPPNAHAEALAGMKGQLWVDVRTYNWVKVSAEVVRPVSIDGFLARVEPGTSFELDEMPADDGIWLPKHFREQSKSEILGVFNHSTHDDETYSQYRKSTAAK